MRITVHSEPVFVQTGGQPFDVNKPALVFLHGAGMDHTVWGQQTRYFAHRGYAVLAVDLPGHGRSGGTAIPTIGDLADWLASFIDALELPSVNLIGHSMGALMALEAAARHAGKTSAVALLGVATRMPVHRDLLAAAADNKPLAAALIASWGHGGRAHRGGNIASGIWLIRNAIRLIERSRPGILATDLKACDVYEGALESAGKIKCPVLMLLGATDRMTPLKVALPLGEAITGSRTVILPNCGHMMMVEEPAQTLSALKTFLASARIDA